MKPRPLPPERPDLQRVRVPFVFLETLGSPRTPTRAHDDDAGFDLYVSEDRLIDPGEFVDVPTGVAMQLPPDSWGLLTGRSSTLRSKGLLVNQGIIDPGYRGELFAGVWNLTRAPVQALEGERLAQLIIVPNATQQTYLELADTLTSHERGEKGFGSSGR